MSSHRPCASCHNNNNNHVEATSVCAGIIPPKVIHSVTSNFRNTRSERHIYPSDDRHLPSHCRCRPGKQQSDLICRAHLTPQKPIASLLEIGASSGSANLPALLGLDASTYSSRLSGKNVLLADLPSSGPSALVQGKKRHRGDPEAKRKVREAQLEAERIRKEKGMEGIRRSRKKVACTGPGSVVE